MSLKKLSSGVYVDLSRVDYFDAADRDDNHGEATISGAWVAFKGDDIPELVGWLDERVALEAADDAEWAEYEAKKAERKAASAVCDSTAVPCGALAGDPEHSIPALPELHPKDGASALWAGPSAGAASQAGPVDQAVVQAVQQPTIGRIVNYVTDGRFQQSGQARPAIIVRVWDDRCVQLQVFTDGDGGAYNDGTLNVVWRTSVMYDASKTVGNTWHWPERKV